MSIQKVTCDMVIFVNADLNFKRNRYQSNRQMHYTKKKLYESVTSLFLSLFSH